MQNASILTLFASLLRTTCAYVLLGLQHDSVFSMLCRVFQRCSEACLLNGCVLLSLHLSAFKLVYVKAERTPVNSLNVKVRPEPYERYNCRSASRKQSLSQIILQRRLQREFQRFACLLGWHEPLHWLTRFAVLVIAGAATALDVASLRVVTKHRSVAGRMATTAAQKTGESSDAPRLTVDAAPCRRPFESCR